MVRIDLVVYIGVIKMSEQEEEEKDRIIEMKADVLREQESEEDD